MPITLVVPNKRYLVGTSYFKLPSLDDFLCLRDKRPADRLRRVLGEARYAAVTGSSRTTATGEFCKHV
jgi:hypothetical protein